MNIKNKISIFLLLCLIFSSSVITYAGTENNKDIEYGTIDVKCAVSNKKISGLDISINKIADKVEDEYVLRENYKYLDIDLNNVKNADCLKKACEEFDSRGMNNENSIMKKTDKNGCVTFNNIEDGAYIVSLGEIDGFEKIAPVIIQVPVYNEITKNMEYNIKCEPKIYMEKVNPPQTGDETYVSLYLIIILFVSVSLIVCLSIIKRHKGLDNK